MGHVFLSYDRADRAKAEALALALEQAGHEVWWDRHIRGGAEYSDEIEQALGKADAVVVLWSQSSVKSAWVRDEAAAGRDSNRLVPVLIDRTKPPMGFRQYQSIDLGDWTLSKRKAAALDDLFAAVGGPAAARPPVVEGTAPDGSNTRWWLAAMAIAALLVVAGAWWWLRGTIAEAPTVAIRPVQAQPASQELARDLFVKLGRLQAANPDALEILEAGAERQPEFTFQVSSHDTAGRSAATLALIGRDRSLLWSKDFDRPQGEIGDLRQQLALTAARVLECASQALASKDRLDQRTLKLYLNGCATLSELSWTDFRSLVPVFQEVTRKAPRFAAGWGKLVETEARVVGWETLPDDSPEAQRLRADIARARKVDPELPEAYWGENILLTPASIAPAAALVERAIASTPDEALIQVLNADFLSRVGRMNDSVEASKRAAELNPLSSDSLGGYVDALLYAGQRDAAIAELAKAEKLWPGVRSLVDSRYRIHLRYGDPREALRIIRSGINPGYAVHESFVLARIDPTPANIDRAIADSRAQIARTPRGSGWLLLALAHFDRNEEIFTYLDQHPDTAFYAPAMFFRPDFHRFRHDVRFMQLMQRQGLVDYWRKSGKWPDFCFEPDLPYDCKVEAAKLAGKRA